jgi:hypothetical protein
LATLIQLVVAAALAFLVSASLLLGFRPAGDASTAVLVWWAGLIAAFVLNLGLWRLAWTALGRKKDELSPRVHATRRVFAALALVYVLVCGFRGVLPRTYVAGICFVDTWLSSPLVGRALATVAELCFGLQFALLLNELARAARSRFAASVSWVMVPLLALAQVACWYSCLTTNCAGQVIEQSLWTLTFFLVTVASARLLPRLDERVRRYVLPGVILGIGFVVFMTTVDVPKYIARVRADEASHRQFLELGAGLKDLWLRRTVTFRWADWHQELAWLGLYFTVTVWASIGIMLVPALELATNETATAEEPGLSSSDALDAARRTSRPTTSARGRRR